jgi:hypothetical protein
MKHENPAFYMLAQDSGPIKPSDFQNSSDQKFRVLAKEFASFKFHGVV